ncbi:MAG: three-Cys-motif partner protein TcmP [Patescibacteria group bacterium]
MWRVKPHTREKLEYFRKYIEAYTTATKKLPLKYYIDAFAGTGKCVLCGEKCSSEGWSRCEKCGRGNLIDGSALISLKIKNKFNGYLFVELNKKSFKILNNLVISEKSNVSPSISVKTRNDDSNKLLKDLYKYIPSRAGCLVFLDPKGAELYWETVVSLSKIRKVDILILYPYDMSLVRLIRDYPKKLDLFYGSTDWSNVYNSKDNYNEKRRKEALLSFYRENLKKLGFEYVVYKQIRRNLRSGKALYHLILVTHSSIGKKIMENIFDKEIDGQTKLC